jgi:cation transport ATPase
LTKQRPDASFSHAGAARSERWSLLTPSGPALITLIAGAAGSVGFMLLVGHQNRSVILLALFSLWVLSPFVLLLLADAVAGWRNRASLYGMMVVVTAVSLGVYGYVALSPRAMKNAFPFLVTPAVLCIFVAAGLTISARRSRRL